MYFSVQDVFYPPAVDIATRYGLDDPGIESRWEARFSAPTQPPIQLVWGSSDGKAAGAWR
jgi:hypothetical protein